MWLIDQEGRVATTNARQDLAAQVEKLLAGKSAAGATAAIAAPSPVVPTPTASPAAPRNGAGLQIKSIAPASPAKLATGEKLKIAIDYLNPEGLAVQIWARPYTKGVRTPGYGAHGSPLYRQRSGTVEGWFEFDRPSVVDEVRVEMVEATTGGKANVVASASLPIEAVWGRESLPAIGAAPDAAKPPTPATEAGTAATPPSKARSKPR
jgi:hypothetical protein